MSTGKRTADVRGRDIEQATVARYLPSNYEVTGWGHDERGDFVRIAGSDQAGWTLDDYVIPRLRSGLMFAVETTTKEDPDG